MGSSFSGGLLLRRAPLRMEDPRAETSGFKASTPVMISYNKEQCNERFGSSRVGSSDRQAEACARGRLRRKEGGGTQPAASTGLDWKPRREQQHRGGSSSKQTTFLTRDVPQKQLRTHQCLLCDNALYQQNNLLQQIVHLEWDQGLREIVHDNNSSIEQIIAEVRPMNQAMGQIIGGVNNAFGQVRTDAQNQRQGMASFHEQMVDVHRKLGILEKEATRLQQAEIGALKERCRKIEHESVRLDRKWPNVHEQLQKIPELERELRASKRDGSPRASSLSGESGINGKTAEGSRTLHGAGGRARINQRSSENTAVDSGPKWRLVLRHAFNRFVHSTNQPITHS